MKNNPMHSSQVIAVISNFCYSENDLTRRANQRYNTSIPKIRGDLTAHPVLATRSARGLQVIFATAAVSGREKRIDDREPADAAAVLHARAEQRIATGLDGGGDNQRVVERELVIFGEHAGDCVKIER